MIVERELPLVEDILGSYKDVIGRDFQAYRNHVYRVVNLCYGAGDFDAETKQKIQIAGCFHDIGIWLASTMDYLEPSESVAKSYLNNTGKEDWVPEVLEMIEKHHCVRSCVDPSQPLIELFRRADVADFSLGLFSMGFSRVSISTLKSEFPNAGFHLRLMQLGSAWIFKNPLNPLPMFRR